MKLTKSKLKQIIKEETRKVLQEELEPGECGVPETKCHGMVRFYDTDNDGKKYYFSPCLRPEVAKSPGPPYGFLRDKKVPLECCLSNTCKEEDLTYPPE